MNDETGDNMWILTGGSYSAYHVVGVFRTKEQADAAAAAINDTDTGYDEYQVEEVPYLDALTVETIDTVQANYFAIYWDGHVRHERIGEPTARVQLAGLPDGERARQVEPMNACDVTISAFEANYTLGVTLEVVGNDIERVRKTYSEQRAQLVAEPAIQTVRAWRRREYLPAWVWGRAENVGILDALAAAGFDRVHGGPIGS